jgi:hypothetical protein
MPYLVSMRPVFFQLCILSSLLLISSACSGPQMISSPPPSDMGATGSKRSENNNQTEIKPDASLDQGVFDDHQFRLKTDLKLWKLIDDEDGIQTFEKIKTNSGLVAFRGEILIPAPLKKVASVLVNDSLQKDWVDSFVESKSIRKINEFEHIEYNQTKVPWPFQNRDFVFRVNAKLNSQPPTILITMKSVEDSAAPIVSGVTRGEIVHSYYYLKETSGFRATKMVVEMEVDPKGAIPLWLVNLSQKGWPHNTLAAVKKLSLRDDIAVVPKIEKYFEIPKTKKIEKRKKK